jgi:NADH-quinone oxidoreductase subunit M
VTDPALVLLAALAMPLLGVGILWAGAPLGRRFVRQSALLTSLITLVLAVRVVTLFPGGTSAFALSKASWLGAGSGLEVSLSLGLDGLSLWLFALSALLTVVSVLVSWTAITDRAAGFYSLLLLLETGMLGVFAARDIILFYVFFEFTLIPLFFLIGIWGSQQRRLAAVKFFLYTFTGSVLTFLGLLTIVLWHALPENAGTLTFSIPALTVGLAEHPLPESWQVWIFLALFVGFAIKVPLFPLHTWLPLAHVQAPTAGSVLLAGVLLKIGAYGFIRFNLPLLPVGSTLCMPWVLWLAAIGIVYGALVALAQTDMKRVIAYSSVSHLGFCMVGLFAFNRLGMQGGTLQMINHGISTGGLFACVGMIYERLHTREIKEIGGLARSMPWLAFFLIVFTFSSISLPGLNGFAGEFLILIGMFQRAWSGAPDAYATQYLAIAVLSVSGMIFGAWYMLYLMQRILFGPLKHPHKAHDEASHHGAALPVDLSWREIAALAPLVVLVVWIGLFPRHFLDPMAPTLNRLADETEAVYLEQRILAPPAIMVEAEPKPSPSPELSQQHILETELAIAQRKGSSPAISQSASILSQSASATPPAVTMESTDQR